MSDKKRVVVTGIGVRTPLGNSMEELAGSLKNNASGIRVMPDWDEIESLRTRVAGVCGNIDENDIPRKHRRTMGRVGVIASLCASDAITDSGLSLDQISSPDCGISFGSTEGSSGSMEEFLSQILSNRSLKGMPSSSYLQFMSHTCAANISSMFQIKGPVIASCTACVAGSQGIGFGFDAIIRGRASIMITGGAEEMHFMDAGIFDIMRATSTKYNDRPELTPRPFDRDRDGLVVAEGGGCLILEDYDHAKKRGARIYAEVAGYGTNCDGTHLTNPSAGGMAGAMEIALKDAGLSADTIDHINAHATATAAGDVAESKATSSIFGDKTPITAFKGYMGHTLGGCGAIESAISIIMMEQSIMFPTRNLENPDPECAPVNHVMGDIREGKVDISMNNNFAFGGINTSLIFTKV